MKENIGMILEHYGEDYGKYYHAIVPPIFMNSLHVFDSIDDYYDLDVTDKHSYCYGRVQNPTVRILEDKIAALESGEVCYTFSSGGYSSSVRCMHNWRTCDLHKKCVWTFKKFSDRIL